MSWSSPADLSSPRVERSSHAPFYSRKFQVRQFACSPRPPFGRVVCPGRGRKMRRLVLVGLSLSCVAFAAAPARAQVYTGRIDVTIKDSTGATLPGVTVDAVGTQTATAVTDSQGEAHFV